MRQHRQQIGRLNGPAALKQKFITDGDVAAQAKERILFVLEVPKIVSDCLKKRSASFRRFVAQGELAG